MVQEISRVMMISTILQLSLAFVVIIALTSSQLTYDAISPDRDASSCDSTEHVLSQLVTAVSQLRNEMSRRISQLQSDVAELKTWREQRQLNETGYSTTPNISTHFTSEFAIRM